MGGKNEIKRIVRERFPKTFPKKNQIDLPADVAFEYVVEDINLAWFDFNWKRMVQNPDTGDWEQDGNKTGRDLIRHLGRNVEHFLNKTSVRKYVVVIDKVRYVPISKQPEQRKRDQAKTSFNEKQNVVPLEWRDPNDGKIIHLDEELPDMHALNANRAARQQAMREAFTLLTQEVEVPLGKEVIIDGWDEDSDVPLRIATTVKEGVKSAPAPEYRNQTGESDTCIPFYTTAFTREDAERYAKFDPSDREELPRHFGGILVISKDTDMIPIALMHSEKRRTDRVLPGEEGHPQRFVNEFYLDLSVKQQIYDQGYKRVFPELCNVNALYESLMRATEERLNIFSIAAIMMMAGNDYIDSYTNITHDRFMQVLFGYFRHLGNLFEEKPETLGLHASAEHYIRVVCFAHYIKLIDQIILRVPKHLKPIFLEENFLSDKLYETNPEIKAIYEAKFPAELVHISEMTRTEIRDLYNKRNQKNKFPEDQVVRERWKRLWWSIEYFWKSPYVNFEELPDVAKLGWKVVHWDEFPSFPICLLSEEDELAVKQKMLETKKRKQALR